MCVRYSTVDKPCHYGCFCPLQMCANCGVTSTRVWRVANAGLMCCNACGMFYQKHHQHRPEHLLAANRAKQDARQAAAAAESPLQDPEPCPSSSDGKLQQHLSEAVCSGMNSRPCIRDRVCDQLVDVSQGHVDFAAAGFQSCCGCECGLALPLTHDNVLTAPQRDMAVA